VNVIKCTSKKKEEVKLKKEKHVFWRKYLSTRHTVFFISAIGAASDYLDDFQAEKKKQVPSIEISFLLSNRYCCFKPV
jgi:hypothetical protein